MPDLPLCSLYTLHAPTVGNDVAQSAVPAAQSYDIVNYTMRYKDLIPGCRYTMRGVYTLLAMPST